MHDKSDKPDAYFETAADLLSQTGSEIGIEQQIIWNMDLQRAATAILEKMEFRDWGRVRANVDIAASLAKALAKIQPAEQLARQMAAGAAVHADPGSDQEREMVELFESLTVPSYDADRRALVTDDCLRVLSDIVSYYNPDDKNRPRTIVPKEGDRGYKLKKAITDRLFQGALFDNLDTLIDGFAIIAECSSVDSAERLAAIVGLLRYPQYIGASTSPEAETYIRTLAPVGSRMRDEAENMLRINATFPLTDLLKCAAEHIAQTHLSDKQ